MKRTLLASTLAFVASTAFAADLMPVKAPPAALFDYQTSGWYIVVETGAAAAQAKVSGAGLFANSLVNGNLIAAGGTVGGCAGYIRGSTASAWGIKSCGDYQNITAGGAGAGTASRWAASTEVQFYGNIFSWLQQTIGSLGVSGFSFPTFSPPSLNGGTNLAAAPHNYLAAGVKFQGVSGSFGASTGATVKVAPMVKAGAVWQTLDASGKPNGGAIDVSAEVAFMGRGVTLNNVFAANGQLGTGGNVGMGTTYTAKIGYLFAVGR